MLKLKNFIIKYAPEIIIFNISLIFSTWLMFSTFSYNNGFMEISAKAWSDFASHIPLIRSFSLGDNFPPQYPLFSGPLIKYHFIFYAFVGWLEKSGIRIDYALNIPSILGFSFLILMIYIFSKELFKSKAVGVLSIIFFLFNSSLSFIDFFKKNPLSLHTISDIINNKSFISFGPYDGNIISAFWNLNIYTNQRHLALAYSLSILIILFVLNIEKIKKNINKQLISLLLGIILGCSFILNMAVYLMTTIVLLGFLVLFKNLRKSILIALLISLPLALYQYALINQTPSLFKLSLHYGYLIEKLTPTTFVYYWLKNLGLSLFIIPLSLIFIDKKNRKILLSFLSLFVIGNLLQFSPEIAANHKFFNFFMIIGGMYCSYFLVLLWRSNKFIKPVIVMLILALTLSGIIDYFPIYNDAKISLPDHLVNKDISWIIKNTKPNSIFLNSDYLYANPSLAGRKIFLGWPYFSWSQGYDTDNRDLLKKELFTTDNLSFFCKNISKNNLDYLDISNNYNNLVYNKDFINNNFIKIYENKISGYNIYSLDKCR